MTGTELGTLARGADEATTWVTTRLEARGLSVTRSFDLRSARAAGGRCTCRSHGTAACDCQMVVLLVYGRQRAPATVMIKNGTHWTLAAQGTLRADLMIEERQIRIRAYGEARPAAPNETAAGRQKNRRAMVVVVEPRGTQQPDDSRR